jgi:NAD+ diphosphatase
MLYELGMHRIELPGAVPTPTAESRVILWHENQVVMNGVDISWPFSGAAIDQNPCEFVGTLNGKAYFTSSISELSATADLRSLRDIAFIGETAFMLCGRARAHLDWRTQHRFCSQCGQSVQQVAQEFAMECVPCRLRFYPRISPCIIVLITHGRRVLLAQGEKHREQGWYSTLAGFIESGESAEQAVIREVKEEVNVDVKNIRYLNSQAWPFPNQLMLGFSAEYAGGDIIPAIGEIADAAWFDIDELPKHPPSISIAGWMIRQFRESISG